MRGRCQIPRVWMLLEGNAQQTFGLDHTLFSITSDRKCYAMQATMLPVGKPLCQEFEITQFRDLSGKDWMECNLLWTSSIASNTLRFHSVWISRWCLQCRGTLAPTNRILGWRPLAVENVFCNVQSAVNVSNATRLTSQRPQREKLPASPDPLRCDDHVIKRVAVAILQCSTHPFDTRGNTGCNNSSSAKLPRNLGMLLSIWKLPAPIPARFCNPLDEG